MGTALNVQAWSATPSSNDGADSTIGTVANTSSPTSVDDWVKGVMAAIAKYADDTGGALVAGGSATALTVTTGQALSSGHIANGLNIKVRTASSATGAATIAIDGLTAVDIKTNAGAAIASGDWASGAVLDLVYSSGATAFLAANIGGTPAINITGLSALTSPDHAADYLPIYDASATSNLKILPRYLAPSVRACFRAHKNGSNQSISSTTETQVTFGTESFDVGSAFASSTWTPPAGKVQIGVNLLVENVGSGQLTIVIKKNSTAIATWLGTAVTNLSSSEMLSLVVIEDANGSDTFAVYATTSADTSYSVEGFATRSYFWGTMI